MDSRTIIMEQRNRGMNLINMLTQTFPLPGLTADEVKSLFTGGPLLIPSSCVFYFIFKYIYA